MKKLSTVAALVALAATTGTAAADEAVEPIKVKAIAGEVIANTYDHTTRALRLEVRGAGATPHLIYVPDGAFTVTCDGASVVASGWAEVPCDGTLEVTPE